MKLSIIIPWHDNGCEWRRKSFDWLRNRYAALLTDYEFVCGSTKNIDDDPHWNRAASRNALVEQSSGDTLLIADADTVFQLDQIERGIAQLLGGAPWVIPYCEERYYNLTADETALVWRCFPGAGIPEPTDPRQWDHKITSWAGLLLVPRAAFDAVGGYDERFKGWGYEDNAFKTALDRVVGPHRRTDGYALHLWHPAPDEECFGQPHIQHNRELFRMYEAGVLP